MVARWHLRRERQFQGSEIVPRNVPGQCEFSGSFLGIFWTDLLGVCNLLTRKGFGAGEWTRTTDLLITNQFISLVQEWTN